MIIHEINESNFSNQLRNKFYRTCLKYQYSFDIFVKNTQKLESFLAKQNCKTYFDGPIRSDHINYTSEKEDNFSIHWQKTNNDKEKVKIVVYAKLPETLQHLYNLLQKENLTEINPKIPLIKYYFLNYMGDLEERTIELTYQEKIYPELYPDIDIQKLLREYCAAKESILILSGEPGTGKTTFLRYLIYNLYATNYKSNDIVYTKDSKLMLQEMFWVHLNEACNLLILDDINFELGPRQTSGSTVGCKEGDSSFVSNLLSYSDGIFSQRHKILITTNIMPDKLDRALIRPGRCFDFIKLNSMTREYAAYVWENVLGMDIKIFRDIYGKNDSHITQASLMSNYMRLQEFSRERMYIKGKNTKKQYTIENKIKELGVDTGRSTSNYF